MSTVAWDAMRGTEGGWPNDTAVIDKRSSVELPESISKQILYGGHNKMLCMGQFEWLLTESDVVLFNIGIYWYIFPFSFLTFN